METGAYGQTESNCESMSYEYLRKIEEREAYFKIITGISVIDVLEFYKCLGRFPSIVEIESIKSLGITKVTKELILKTIDNHFNRFINDLS